LTDLKPENSDPTHLAECKQRRFFEDNPPLSSAILFFKFRLAFSASPAVTI
jgi:hypothetical protein